jgi:hypothetical protein
MRPLASILCYAASNKPNQQRNGREIMDYERRTILTAAGAAAAMAATSRQLFAGWEPSERYPDPAVQALDPSFAKYRLLLAGVERLAVGITIWIKNANRWHVNDGQAFLASSFSQQRGRLEYRRRIRVLVIEDWWGKRASKLLMIERDVPHCQIYVSSVRCEVVEEHEQLGTMGERLSDQGRT